MNIKKIISYFSLFVIMLYSGGLNLSSVDAVNLTALSDGTVDGQNFLGLINSSYKLKRQYTFNNGKFLALPAGFGKVDTYLVESYDGDNNKWVLQYLATVNGDEVYKLGDRFNSLSFYTTLGGEKIIYTFYNTGGTGRQILKVGEIKDSNAIPLEYKDNIVLLKKEQVLKKIKVCEGQDNCSTFNTNNPDIVDSDNFICDTNTDNITCYELMHGDAIYAYSIKDISKGFIINDVDNAGFQGVSYDGMYDWANYADHYDINNPIKINGLFLYNIDYIGSIKYYNLFTNVNWENGAGTGTVNQIVMSTIKVYPDAQLSLDELAGITGDNIVFSGDLNFKVYQY